MSLPVVEAVFGPYRLLSRLGQGASSDIYLATRGQDQGRVALKILSPATTEDAVWLRRFQREALVMQQLRHQNVIQWIESGECEGRWYLAMELAEGRGVRTLIGPRHKPGSLARFGVQIASGLASAHSLGLIHRDLKPENLMLTPEGVVKILDFGLARPVQPGFPGFPQHLARITASGVILGTPRYMSPEQVLGDPLTSATDLFCLGLCLFEMAAGRHPFASDFYREVMSNIQEMPTPPLTRWRPDLPAEMREIIESMLLKDPSKRPSAESAFHRLKALSQP